MDGKQKDKLITKLGAPKPDVEVGALLKSLTMPHTQQLVLFDLSDYTVRPERFNLIKYLCAARWDDKVFVGLKSCVLCVMFGIAPVQRPVRHKESVRIEIMRRKETPGEYSKRFHYKTDSIANDAAYQRKQHRRDSFNRVRIRMAKKYALSY